MVWFCLLRPYFESCLEALKLRHHEDTELANTLSRLIPLEAGKLPAGWLKLLVRMITNSGRWRQTRSACMSA